MVVAVIAALADPGLATAVILAATVAARAAVDAAAERVAGVRRPLAIYPVLSAARDLLVGAVWAVPFVSSSVNWRGRTFTIGPRTLLLGGGNPDPGAGERAGEAVGPAFAGS